MGSGVGINVITKRSRSEKLICTADVNAFALIMALVVFAVLVFSMTEMGNHPHGGVSVDLPRVSHPRAVGGLTWGANRRDAMLVAVFRDNHVFFKTDRVSVDALPAKIRESLAQGAEKRVYIRADRRARYGDIKSVLEALQTAGIEDVSFIADQSRASSSVE